MSKERSETDVMYTITEKEVFAQLNKQLQQAIQMMIRLDLYNFPLHSCGQDFISCRCSTRDRDQLWRERTKG